MKKTTSSLGAIFMALTLTSCTFNLNSSSGDGSGAASLPSTETGESSSAFSSVDEGSEITKDAALVKLGAAYANFLNSDKLAVELTAPSFDFTMKLTNIYGSGTITDGVEITSVRQPELSDTKIANAKGSAAFANLNGEASDKTGIVQITQGNIETYGGPYNDLTKGVTAGGDVSGFVLYAYKERFYMPLENVDAYNNLMAAYRAFDGHTYTPVEASTGYTATGILPLFSYLPFCTGKDPITRDDLDEEGSGLLAAIAYYEELYDFEISLYPYFDFKGYEDGSIAITLDIQGQEEFGSFITANRDWLEGSSSVDFDTVLEKSTFDHFTLNIQIDGENNLSSLELDADFDELLIYDQTNTYINGDNVSINGFQYYFDVDGGFDLDFSYDVDVTLPEDLTSSQGGTILA